MHFAISSFKLENICAALMHIALLHCRVSVRVRVLLNSQIGRSRQVSKCLLNITYECNIIDNTSRSSYAMHYAAMQHASDVSQIVTNA